MTTPTLLLEFGSDGLALCIGRIVHLKQLSRMQRDQLIHVNEVDGQLTRLMTLTYFEKKGLAF